MNRFVHRQAARAVAAAIVCLVIAGGAPAEVRVEQPPAEAPVLEIRPAPSGPWSLLGPNAPAVLNASGDTHGDGYPGDAAQDERLLAAWLRPASGLLLLSDWDSEEWRELSPVASPDAVGVPRVDALAPAWALTWQEVRADLPLITVTGVSREGGTGEASAMFAGWLVDTAFVGEVQLVLSLTPDRSAEVLTAILWSVPSVPSPVEILWSRELRRLDDRGDSTLGVEGPARFAVPHAPALATTVPSWTLSWIEHGSTRRVVVDASGAIHERREIGAEAASERPTRRVFLPPAR